MTNLFTNLSKNGSEPVNGSRMDRHYTENGPIHSRQLFAVLAMLWVKLVNLVNFVMQICAESLKSLKSLMQIFVGKASCESTVMYRVKSRIPSCYLRYSLDSHLSRFSLASLICLCMLTVGVGNAWGTVSGSIATSISAGDQIVIVNTGEANELTGVTSNVGQQASYSTAPAGTYILTVEAGKSGSGYSFKDGSNNYLAYTKVAGTTRNNNLFLIASPSTNDQKKQCSWTVSINGSTKEATITNVYNTERSLKFNSDRFCCYTSAQTAIKIFKIAAAGPTITTSVSSLTEVGYSTADFSQQVKSFTVSGSSLTANVTVTAPTNYEVCKTSGGPYTSSVSFDKGSGTLAASTVYVRLQSGKTVGNYSGNVACSSSGATTKNVSVSGSVPFTVTWKANGTTHATTYVTYATGTGTALGSLPDDPDPSDYTCSPKAFYGWYDGESYSNASVAPSVISTSTKITTDKTYNAVFADISGSTTTYDLITTAAGLVAGEQYVIGHKTSGGSYYYMPNAASNSNPTLSTITTVTGTQITSTVTNAMLWTLRTSDVSGYGYKWESVASSSNFLATATSTGNNIRVGTSSSFSMNSWSISVDATYGWILKSNGTYTSSGNTKTGKYAVIYGDSEWRVYSANSTNAQAGAKFVIFKKSAVATYSNYATSCCTPLGSINGSFF